MDTSPTRMQLPRELQGLRVSLVHDWLLTWRGGEKVLDAVAELFPQAPIFTLFHRPALMPPSIESHRIIASSLNSIPGAHARHRHFLPLMPTAIQRMDVGPADVVISSSHCVAKGVAVPKGAKHLSYVHAPLRYMWDRFDDYFGPGRSSWAVRLAAQALRPSFQSWDVRTARQVHHFVANSAHVASQIRQRYGRVAEVIHPPVELERFTTQSLAGSGRGGYFLCLGALAPYKRIDLVIDAFKRNGRTLWVGGTGQSSAWLAQLPPNIKALGQVSDHELPALYRNARALIFPGIEDFGITPLEAQACGRPVIAFSQGGVLETTTPQTALLFHQQTAAALDEALTAFDAFESSFEPEVARAQALKFSRAAFQSRFIEALLACLGATNPLFSQGM